MIFRYISKIFLVTLFCTHSFANYSDMVQAGFVPITDDTNKMYTDVKADTHIENLPEVQNQGGLPICTQMSTAQALNIISCQQNNIPDCKKMPDELKVSILDLISRSSNPNYMYRDIDKIRAKKDPLEVGINPAALLVNGVCADKVITTVQAESCVSFKKYFSGNSEADSEQIWLKFQGLYQDIVKAPKDCDECLSRFTSSANDQELIHRWDLRKDELRALKEASNETLSQTMQQLFAYLKSSCAIGPNPSTPPKADSVDLSCIHYENGEQVSNIQLFPPKDLIADPKKLKDSSAAAYKKSKEFLVKNLNKKIPVIVSNICLAKKNIVFNSDYDRDNCLNSNNQSLLHSVLATGIKTVCDPKTKDCKDFIHIQNSWGQEWQNEFADGWIEAKTLLDRTGYTQNTFVLFDNAQ